jgi:putative transposase
MSVVSEFLAGFIEKCRNNGKVQSMEYTRDEHRVHVIVYYLIWCAKRRKPVLVDPVAENCRQLIEDKCQTKGWELLDLAIQPDHVHLFVRVWPTNSAAEVVKECKAATSRVLRKKYPHLLKLPSLWTRSYFASTAGNVSQETIKKYIAAQSKR